MSESKPSGLQPSPVVVAGDRVSDWEAKPPEVRYLGFRTTAAGREYSLRATDERETRLFVVVITHEVLASPAVRFQDGPDLCFAKLQRDLAVEPALPAGSRIVLTRRDLVEHRNARERRTSSRHRSTG